MRRISLLLAFAILPFQLSLGQNTDFVREADMPDATNFLPAHPKPGSDRFALDSCLYEWGKTVRNTPRGQQAVSDAKLNPEALCIVFTEPFGYTLSETDTPEIFKIISYAGRNASHAVNRAKNYYMRPRPYMHFNEPTATPWDEEKLRKNGSYPSGHSTWGWFTALLLAEINPEAQDAILARGYEYGQSRVIVGVHYQSDVDAGRVAASAAFARLHADEGFCEQLAKAKKEFAELKASK